MIVLLAMSIWNIKYGLCAYWNFTIEIFGLFFVLSSRLTIRFFAISNFEFLVKFQTLNKVPQPNFLIQYCISCMLWMNSWHKFVNLLFLNLFWISVQSIFMVYASLLCKSNCIILVFLFRWLLILMLASLNSNLRLNWFKFHHLLLLFIWSS